MKRDKRLHKMVEVMRGVYHDDKQVTTLLVKKGMPSVQELT